MMRWKKSGTAAGVSALLVMAAACGGEGGAGAASGPVVRDSAGITIVENREPTWEAGEAWLVDAEPVLAIGTLDGPPETQFFDLRSARFRSDGSVVAADEGSHRIVAFASDGAFLWEQGRQGDGPGEYRRAGGVHVMAGDSVLVYDQGARRVTVLAPGGALARSYIPEVPEAAILNAPAGIVSPGLTASNGGAIFGTDDEVTAGRLERRLERHFLTDTEGRVVDTLPSVPGTEFWLVANQSFVSIWEVPFGKSSETAVGAGVVAMGLTERPEWLILDGSGDLRRIVRIDAEAPPVTGEDWSRAQEALLPEDAGSQQRAQVRESFADIVAPDRWPVFSDVLLDDEGYLWVQRYPAPWEEEMPTRWWVFDPDGGLMGEVALPAGFQADQVRGDRVVGRWRDDLGVEQIRVHRIVGR
jgi:hypothetical protein